MQARTSTPVRTILTLALAVLLALGVSPGVTARASTVEGEATGTSAIGEPATLDAPDAGDGSAAEPLAASYETLRITGTEMYEYAFQVLDIVNEERAAEGLSPLTMDADLLDAAMQRAAETAVYWDHTRPNGSICFTVSGKAYGENIAAGQASPASVMSSWMNSSGHRANILGSSYRSIGIGCFRASDGTLRWVQLFGISSASATASRGDAAATRSVQVNLSFFQPSLTLDVDATDQGGWISLGIGEGVTPVIMLTNSGWGRPVIDNSSFAWESSEPAHVSVSSGGTMTGVGDGTAIVTVSFASSGASMRVMSGLTPNHVYSDVDGHWGEGWAMAATETGLMTGYADEQGVSRGLFGPEDTVTRAQLATILYRHANPDSDATTDASAFEDDETGMTDVEDQQFYTAAINWAYETGVMRGDVDGETGESLGTMRPNSQVNREEAATMLARYAAYCGVDTSADPSVYAGAPDAARVSEYARGAIAWCYEMGVMTGYGDTGALGPQDSTTRAAMAKMAVLVTEIIG